MKDLFFLLVIFTRCWIICLLWLRILLWRWWWYWNAFLSRLAFVHIFSMICINKVVAHCVYLFCIYWVNHCSRTAGIFEKISDKLSMSWVKGLICFSSSKVKKWYCLSWECPAERQDEGRLSDRKSCPVPEPVFTLDIIGSNFHII